MKISFSCLVCLLSFVTVVWAQQPAQSLSDVAQKVQKGDRVKVTAKDGTVVSGRFDDVSGSSLRISISGKPQDFPVATIKEISRKRPEPGWNGALIGLGVGAAASAVAVSTTCSNDPECNTYAAIAFIPAFVGGGAAVGAIIDSLISKYDPIFVQQASLDRMRLRLSPVVRKDAKGVQVSVSF